MRASNYPGLAIPKFFVPCSPELSESVFRQKVWDRDGGRSRFTGEPLSKSDPNWRFRGEVAHLVTKGAHPELRLIVSNALLLSAEEHWLSDHRGGRRLRLFDPETSEPATDASKPIQFVLTDFRGVVLWTRVR